MTETVKPKCPECKVELVLVDGKPPEKCAACGFILEGYENFKRWFAAIVKDATPEPIQGKKSTNPLSAFSRLVK